MLKQGHLTILLWLSNAFYVFKTDLDKHNAFNIEFDTKLSFHHFLALLNIWLCILWEVMFQCVPTVSNRLAVKFMHDMLFIME